MRVGTLPGAYEDFQLPPGDVTFKWAAAGPGQVNVSNGIDIAVVSPQLNVRLLPAGNLQQLSIPLGGANMRVVARRKTFAGAFDVAVSIDLVLPQ
jgi:hypothetical protein